MRPFIFDPAVCGSHITEENGFKFQLKANRIGYFVLCSPAQREVTHSKGTTVRYVKHTVIGIGYRDRATCFRGLAFFDAPVRLLIILLIALGVGYASGNILTGAFWAFLFYLLICFLSASDDDGLLWKVKQLYRSLH